MFSFGIALKNASEIPRHVLSKTSFMRGVQCLRQLYFYKHHYGERDEIPTVRKQIFQRGTDIGLLARKLFPGGRDLTPAHPWDYREAVAQTEEFARKGEILYEAAFQYNGLVVAVDILVPTNDGRFDVYEVKSASRLKGQYIKDIALQSWVMGQSGFRPRRLYLVLLNTDYVLEGELDVEALFKKHEVNHQAELLYPELESQLKVAMETVQKPYPPLIGQGEQCNRPYPCDFTTLCYGGNKPKPMENAAVEISIDRQRLQAWLDKLQGPLSFFDMEAFMPAVPFIRGTSPFQAVPFQFGICNGEGEYVTHLAEHRRDPRPGLLEALLRHVPKEGSILVFDTSMEKQALKDLAKVDPSREDGLKDIRSRFVDIRLPFTEGFVSITSSFDQSLTGLIKALHQAGVIGVALMDAAEGIAHGMGANMAFESLWYEMDLFEQATVIEKLHVYQKNDVMAVLLLWRALKKLAST